MGGEVVNPFTRLRLFVRDYMDEFPVVWCLARTRDCLRNGGHRYGEPEDTSIGFMRTCSRCGCGESVPRSTMSVSPTASTGSQSTFTITGGTYQ